MVQQMPGHYPNMPNMMKYLSPNQRMIVPQQPMMMMPGGYTGFPQHPQSNINQPNQFDKKVQFPQYFNTINQMNFPQPSQIINSSTQAPKVNNIIPVPKIPIAPKVPEDDIKIDKA